MGFQIAGQVAGLVFITGGLFFCAVGVLGIVRFPDVYSRIHASGKVSSLGTVGILVGTAFLLPETAFKLIVLGMFLVISAPVAAHAIALAAHRQGVPRANVARDDLADLHTNSE
jgi:multicomponent Na+:H+ antiporter subunit G